MHPVAVLAGGLGTRVQHLTGRSFPKAMLPILGRPFIDFKLAGLARQGATKVALLVGHSAEPLIAHVRDGSSFGLEVEILKDPPQLAGTGGAVKAALPALGGTFWVTYADTYLRFDAISAEERFARIDGSGMMTVLANRDRWDSSNVKVKGNLVVEYRKGAPPGAYNYIDYGMILLTRKAFSAREYEPPFDLEPLLQDLISSSQLRAFEVEERFFEVGTPTGIKETERFFTESGELERLSGFLPSP